MMLSGRCLSSFLLIISIVTVTFASNSNVFTITKKGKSEGEQCISTSMYTKPKKGASCKDLGSCYRYRCGAIARHCSECEARKGPCQNFSSNSQATRNRRSAGIAMEPLGNLTSPSTISGFRDLLILEVGNLINQVQNVISASETPTVVPVEKIGNALVHIKAGATSCSGFVTTVDTPQGTKHLIMTAAQCLVKFETECRSALEKFGTKFTANTSSGQMVDGYMTYAYNHSWPCFGDYDSDITRVKKSFRSYTVVVTSYLGRSVTIPLTSKYVIIPRDYMECQDCRFDFAAIKLRSSEARSILRGHQPFILKPDKEPIDLTGNDITQFVTVEKTVGPEKFKKAADSQFCTISYTTNEKLCFKLPIAPNVNNPPQLLPGSPLFIPYENADGQTEYHCIGIFSNFYSVVEEDLSTDYFFDDEIPGPPLPGTPSVNLKYSKNGAVRVTRKLVTFLENFAGAAMMRVTSGQSSKLQPLVSLPRREYFPNFRDPHDATEHLYLCALGFKNERDHCKQPDFKISEECSWDGVAFVCDLERNISQSKTDEPSQIFSSNVIPGTTKHLSLRGHGMSDMKELEAVLRHLPSLEELFLDDNKIVNLHSRILYWNSNLRVLSMKNAGVRYLSFNAFYRNPNLRHLDLAQNKITGLHGNLLAKATRLEYFNVENNNVRFVAPTLLRHNAKLKELFLGNNNISYFAGKLLHRVTMLTDFRINNNRLLRIANGLLNKNGLLQTVDFSHNNLSIVAKNTFDNNRELRYVNLNYNRITFLPYRLFSNQRKLVAVNASENPLQHPDKTQRYFLSIKVPYS